MSQKIKFTDKQISEMMSMYSQGKLIKEIAPLFGTSNSTIARTLRKAGVESRHPSVTLKREKLAIEYYNKYQNLDKVEMLIHMNSKTIKKILKKNGIHVLSNSEAHKVRTIDENFFDNIDSHRKAYYLGFLCADGSVSGSNNRVQVSIQERDRNIIDALKEDLKTDYKIVKMSYSQKNQNWQDQCCLTITNAAIHDALILHGVIPNKSKLLEFPKGLDKKYYSSFILGYMDGDGNISKNPKDMRCNFVSTEKFCLSVADILKEELGINCSIMLCHRNSKVATRVLQIAGKNQVSKFLNWIYSDCDIYLERKYKIYQQLYK